MRDFTWFVIFTNFLFFWKHILKIWPYCLHVWHIWEFTQSGHEGGVDGGFERTPRLYWCASRKGKLIKISMDFTSNMFPDIPFLGAKKSTKKPTNFRRFSVEISDFCRASSSTRTMLKATFLSDEMRDRNKNSCVTIYDLVNIQKAIENGHRNSEFCHEKWWFSIVMLVYQ